MQRRFVKRYGIYFFYDQQGQVDTYVIHFLEHMLPHFSKTVVVVNGLLTKESRLQLSALPNVSIIVRENVGFDVWAYKTALDYWGWDELADCDELVMMNFTIMGPVNSFDDMFAEMSLRDVDFWGITVHNGADFDPWGQIPDGKIPIHLQSHFLAFRHNFVVSREFQAYWDDPPQIDSYEDSVSRHEVLFTERFSNQGFTWSVYVDTSDTQRLLHYPLFNSPVDLIANRNCPIFKRKTFLVAPDSYLSENSNGVAGDLLRYLRSSEKFDLELLVPHIARCAHASHLELSLNSYFFPGGLASENSPHRVGVVAISPSPTEVKLIIERMRGAGIVDLFVVDETGLIDVETSSRLADGGRGGGRGRPRGTCRCREQGFARAQAHRESRFRSICVRLGAIPAISGRRQFGTSENGFGRAAEWKKSC
jgi:rhamnosyltransferase